MSTPIVYDKAKYHAETVELAGLDEIQTQVHTAFFLGWLIDNDLMSDNLAVNCAELIAEHKARRKTSLDVYSWFDCCLVDDMLSDKGNAFTTHYFDFENGQYLSDYDELLAFDLPSEFHVTYNWDNYDIISLQINRRYADWLVSRNGG